MKGIQSNNVCYLMIKKFYKGLFAKRTKQPYMKHIDEGIMVLDYYNAGIRAKEAFCLHPIFQNTEDLKKYLIPDPNRQDLKTESVILAMEYRACANSYLSNSKRNGPCRIPIDEVVNMLRADKVQNYKDFITYHKGVHPRSEELDLYFKTWLAYLDVPMKEFDLICTLINEESKYEK